MKGKTICVYDAPHGQPVDTLEFNEKVRLVENPRRYRNAGQQAAVDGDTMSFPSGSLWLKIERASGVQGYLEYGFIQPYAFRVWDTPYVPKETKPKTKRAEIAPRKRKETKL